ncbi:MAG: hypothetical protein SF029_20620 [bacterium]|nr:hypothetical protein [bacterium]
MTLTCVDGDPLHTRAHVLAFGHNARGRTELGDFETHLASRYPAAFSTYTRLCKQERITAGTYWLWRDSRPILMFAVVRASATGATRLRYVQSIALKLAQEYRLEGLRSVAFAPLGSAIEQAELRPILETWLGRSALPVVVYRSIMPGVQAVEGFEQGQPG